VIDQAREFRRRKRIRVSAFILATSQLPAVLPQAVMAMNSPGTPACHDAIKEVLSIYMYIAQDHQQ
jgi:hypothetical protein